MSVSVPEVPPGFEKINTDESRSRSSSKSPGDSATAVPETLGVACKKALVLQRPLGEVSDLLLGDVLSTGDEANVLVHNDSLKKQLHARDLKVRRLKARLAELGYADDGGEKLDDNCGRDGLVQELSDRVHELTENLAHSRKMCSGLVKLLTANNNSVRPTVSHNTRRDGRSRTGGFVAASPVDSLEDPDSQDVSPGIASICKMYPNADVSTLKKIMKQLNALKKTTTGHSDGLLPTPSDMPPGFPFSAKSQSQSQSTPSIYSSPSPEHFEAPSDSNLLEAIRVLQEIDSSSHAGIL